MVGFFICCRAVSADGLKFSDLNIYTTHTINGTVQPYTPKIGEQYQVTLEYNLSKTASAPYFVRLEMANKHHNIRVTDISPGFHRITTQFSLPLDGPINIEARVPCDANNVQDDRSTAAIVQVYGNSKDNSSIQVVRGTFTPVPPDQAIEYYAPKTIEGTQTATNIERIVTMAGCLLSASWQKVLQDDCHISYAGGQKSLIPYQVENASRYPVFFWDCHNLPPSPIVMRHHFKAELSSVRVNAERLRSVSWSDMDAARQSPEFSFYSKSEKVIESSDPAIAAFVDNAVGCSYRARMTPYDAARLMVGLLLMAQEATLGPRMVRLLMDLATFLRLIRE